MARRGPGSDGLGAPAGLGWSLAATLVAVALGSPAAADEVAKAVFERVSPSVVSITDVESFGSGIVVNRSGQIVTNLHVVQAGLPLRVTAWVEVDGQRVVRTFDDVVVTAAHAQYDAALLQVKAPEGVRFIAMSRSPRPFATGDACYAIGNPAGEGGEALTNTITRGVIGAAERTIGGLPYIQTSAQVNPGNSGGALCNAAGEVVGIVTFKVEQSEGLGFAISIAATETAGFRRVPPPIPSPVLLNLRATELTGLAQQVRGRDREAVLLEALNCYRLALHGAKQPAVAYHEVGAAHARLGNGAVADRYYERSIELDPELASPYLQLGLSRLDQGDAATANRLWLRGLAATGPPFDRAFCAENYAIALTRTDRLAEAAYFVAWGAALRGGRDPGRSKKLLATCDRALNDAQRWFARQPRPATEFSTPAGLAAFLALTGDAPEPLDPTRAAPVEPPTPRLPDFVAPRDEAVPRAEVAKVVAGGQRPGRAGWTCQLPGRLADAAIAYGGAYLVLRFQKKPGLTVFDLAHARFMGELETGSEDFAFAAGGRWAVVYEPKTRQLVRWDLADLSRHDARECPLDGGVTHLAMGLDDGSRALVAFVGDGPDADLRFALLDLRGLRTHELTAVWPQKGLRRGDGIALRADARLSAVTSWRLNRFPEGMVHVRFGDSEIVAVEDGSGAGYLALGAAPERIYGGNGQVLNDHFDEKATYRGSFLVPVWGGPYYLEIADRFGKEVHVRHEESHRVVAKTPLPMAFGLGDPDNIPRDRQVWASVPAARIAFIDVDRERIHLVHLPVEPELTASPGQRWAVRLLAERGTRVVVEDAPDGVFFHEPTGQLRWLVPETVAAGRHLILLSLVPKGGEERYQRVYVRVVR